MTDPKVQKWGNSMALPIPATTLCAWGITEGQSVALLVKDSTLVARPAQQRYTLAALMAQCDLSQPVIADTREWIEGTPIGLESLEGV